MSVIVEIRPHTKARAAGVNARVVGESEKVSDGSTLSADTRRQARACREI